MRASVIALGLVGILLLAACGAAAEPAAATTTTPATTTEVVVTTEATTTPPSTSTTVPETTTSLIVATTTTTTTLPPSVCPQPTPLPEGTVTFAAVGGDFDGDGSQDQLQTYQAGVDDWRVRVMFADGGAADAAIANSEDFAPPRPIGGFDVDGDGAQEAFLTVGSGASTVQVGLFDVADCVATRVTSGGVAAEFSVGASIGNVSGISCPGDGSIHRNFAQFVAEDVYEGGFEPFVLEGAVLTAFPGDGAGFTAAEAFALAVLNCGGLSLP